MIPYCKEGSVVVLCAYLGQLSKHERDEVALGENDEQEESLIERVSVSQRVSIQSVDLSLNTD